MVIFYALLALCYSSSALAQIAGLGSCPEIETMSNFHLPKLTGKWYEARRYFVPTEMTVKCVTYSFKHSAHDTMLLNTTAISRLTGNIKSIDGINVRVPDSAESSKLQFRLPSSKVWNDYWILGTDYHTYVIAYSCIDLKWINLKYIWISTRKRHPSEAVVDEAVKIMEKQKLNKKWLLKTDQMNCKVKPDANEMQTSEELNILY